MTRRRILRALWASLVTMVLLVLLLAGLNRPLDELSLLLLCLLVVGTGIFTGVKTK